MKHFLVFFICMILISCSSDKKEVALKNEGLELSNIDSTIRVQDDLFKHANGNWLNKTKIPADQGAWGSFNELYDESQKVLLNILNEAAVSDKYPEGSDQRKAADFYSIGMDSLLAEKIGYAALDSYNKIINEITNKNQVQNYLVEDAFTGGDVFAFPYIDSDAKDSNKPVLWLYHSTLGLPERDYYLKQDAKSKEIREKYKEHLSNLFVLTGVNKEQSLKQAELILRLETQLARTMLSKEDTRDTYKMYHPMSVTEVSKLMPSINWTSYLSALSVKEDTLIVTEPAYFKEFEKVVSQNKIEDVKVFLRASLLRKSAPYLNHAFVQEAFNFNRKYLDGIEQLRPRWKRVLYETDNALSYAIGKLYVEEKFPPEARKKALEMVDNIKLAFADRIKGLDWMSDSTKQKALKKLSKFTVKIGYPDKWKDYTALEIEKNPEKVSYLKNTMNSRKFNMEREFAKLGKQADKSEWLMTPQTINAYYNSSYNEIVFPAAILQPPFYNYKADEAVNYGGIGAVIGHEISHGFDDSGSQYDGDGNLQNWWSEEDLKKFKAKGKALVDQFNKYEALPGVFLQGQYTLGENIGDLGGIAIAYDGLQRSMREKGKPQLIDGYTPEQRFFLSWATIWHSKSRDEALRTQVSVDPHSPEMFRANGPVSNMPQFYDAFGIKPGDKMYREEKDRVKIW